MTDDTVIRARVPLELAQAFALACEVKDVTASQALRQFMREYVAQHAQPDLFKKPKAKKKKVRR